MEWWWDAFGRIYGRPSNATPRPDATLLAWFPDGATQLLMQCRACGFELGHLLQSDKSADEQMTGIERATCEDLCYGWAALWRNIATSYYWICLQREDQCS